MIKTTKKNQRLFLSKVRYITFCTIKSILVTAAVMLGMKWLGELLEIVSNYISVGAGIFAVFAAACFFIHIDSKNSVEQTCKNNKIFIDNR